jgi:Fe2+ or Zn2+ uptake regulation protein
MKGPDGLMHFDANTALHHHLVCQRCGSIVDVEIERLPPAVAAPRCPHTGKRLHGWSLQGVQIELKGLCPACR